MTRERPPTNDLPTFGPTFDAMCAAAAVHWRTTVAPAPPGAPFVVVDLLMQDLRLALRTLTLANSLRRLHAAHIVVLVGPDPYWRRRIWDGYDQERLVQLARAYGAEQVLDMAELASSVASGATTLDVCGRTLAVAPPADGSRREHVKAVADATAVRVLRVPRVTDAGVEDDVPGIERAVAAEDRLYRSLFGGLPVLAFVTSHVDYGQWGLAAEAATAAAVPVIHAQATGGLKAYALFPDAENADTGFRRALTVQIARQFDEQVWAKRDALGTSAERTAWRSKANLGRPSWWRGGGEISRLDLRTTEEREALRGHALERLGLDPQKPVVTVFDHAVSDAVGGNHEAFPDLATWFERTVEFARAHETVSWLFLDHPSQINYDRTEHFEQLARQNADARHLAFRPSLALSRNSLWSVTDVAVTVRGSVSAEFPAYGVPALQAGWSEWSHLGFTRRADTEEAYYRELTRCVRELEAGSPLLTEEDVRRARLWLWFYRSGADVTSPLVPHWENGQGTALHQLVLTAMNHVEDDADPSYVAVRRLWERRDPVLTRMDLGLESEHLASVHALPSHHRSVEAPSGLATAYDDLTAPGHRQRVTSGHSPVVRMVEGFVRGGAIVGRAGQAEAVVVLDTGAADCPRVIELELALDADSATWWEQRSSQRHLDALRTPRRIQVGLAGVPGTEVTVSPTSILGGRPMVVVPVTIQVPPSSDRLAAVVLRSASRDRDGSLPESVIGMRINALTIGSES